MHIFDDTPKSWSCPVHPEQVRPGENAVFSWCFEDPFAVSFRGEEYRFPGGIAIKALCSWKSELFSAEVSVSTEGETACARCLSNVPLAIEGTFLYFYGLRSPVNEGTGSDEGDVILLERWPDFLDLGPLAWESLVAELPGVALCDESCKGLCPVCGANRNEMTCSCDSIATDPRLSTLGDIKL